jgi:hypothetical protein
MHAWSTQTKAGLTHAKSRDVLEKAGFQGISEQFVELRRPNLNGVQGVPSSNLGAPTS